jgi:thiamine-monophosphate kinase
MTGEFDAIRALAATLGPAPAGEIGIGDDAAAAPSEAAPWTLLAIDSVVAGVHADLALVGLDDLGWKAVAVNVSDIAAMGGEPTRCVVSVAGSGRTELSELYRGIAAAARELACPVVGGDLCTARGLVVSVAITGRAEGPPVLRSGASSGERIWVTGPLGASAAGLRELRAGASRGDPLPSLHARPRPRVAEGLAARRVGATAMIDVSDGFAADLWHLARASGVGFELDDVPVRAGATLEEALSGGEDYQLVFTAPADAEVLAGFAGLDPPIPVGWCTAEAGSGRLRGEVLPALGWQHPW